MRHPVLPLIAASAILLLAGSATITIPRDRVELTAATAKAALVELLEQTDDTDLSRYLVPLKETDAVIEDDGRTVRFGPLACDIPARRFNLFIVSFDERDFIDWSGTFIQRNCKWIAKVKEKRQT